MSREPGPGESKWELVPRRRKFTTGDLMVVVALAAIAFSATNVLNLSSVERLFFGILTLVSLMIQALQWRFASMSSGRARPASNVIYAHLSALAAVPVLAYLMILLVMLPESIPLVVGTMLLLTIYLTTWD